MAYQFKYRSIAEALQEALQDDSFYITLKHSVAGDDLLKREAMYRYMDYSMIEGERYGTLFIPDKHQQGASIWAKPLDPASESERKSQKKSFLLNHMGQDSLKCYLDITDFMSQKLVNLIPADAWYLSIVGLKPSLQGRGLGPGLISNVLERTDAIQVSTYLETFNPRNINFYSQLGYKNIGTFDEPTTKSGYTIMVREPLF